jgi:hypothetical protein
MAEGARFTAGVVNVPSITSRTSIHAYPLVFTT